MAKTSTRTQPPTRRNAATPAGVKTPEQIRAEQEAEAERQAAEEEAEREAEQREAEENERAANEAAEQEAERQAEATRTARAAVRYQEEEVNNNDFFARMENLEEELSSSGIKTTGEIKFVIERRDPSSGQFKYCKTLHGDFPSLDNLGKDLGGGEYSVKIHAPSGPEGQLRYWKFLKFTIDTIDFPAKKPYVDPATQTAAVVLPPATDPALLELIRQGQQQHADLMLALKQQDNGGKSKLAEIVEVMTAVKALTPEVKIPDMSPQKMVSELASMFNAGMEMAERMREGDKEKGLGEVALEVLTKALEKIDLGTILGGGIPRPPALPQGPAAPAPAAPAPQAVENVLAVLNEFFAEVILGYDNVMTPHPYCFAEKIRKIPRLAPVLKWCTSMTPDQIVQALASIKAGPLKDKMALPEFEEYIRDILDCVMDFDLIVTVDEEGEVVKKPKEVKPNDNIPAAVPDNGKPAGAEQPK